MAEPLSPQNPVSDVPLTADAPPSAMEAVPDAPVATRPDSAPSDPWLAEDPLGRNWKPLGPSARTGRPFPLAVARIWRWGRWAVTLPLLFYLGLFLLTSIPRVSYPFELEWFEGHLALQVQRVVDGQPQYPPLGHGWATYGYPPVYFWVVSLFFRLFGWGMVWGRLVSLLSTLLASVGTILLIRDRTRKWLPAVVGGLMLFPYFKPAGFWFDLFRVDMLAQALLAWGAFLTLKRHRRPWQLATGLILLALAPFTKQTVAPVSAVIFILVFFQYWKIGRYLLLLGLIGLFNAAAFFSALPKTERDQWVWTYKYLVENPDNHPFYWNRIDPEGKPPNERALQFTQAPLASSKDYLAKFQANTPEVWGKLYVLLLVPFGLTALWVLATLLRFKPLRGGLWLLFAVFLFSSSIVSWAMYGGFENNFIPAFWVASVLVGLAYGGILHLLPRRWMRGALDALVLTLLVIQFFPWLYRKVPMDSTPFGYRPSQQQPAPSSVEKGNEIVRWIADQEGNVYIPHHVYLSHLAGKEGFYSIDAVRDLEISRIPLPRDLLERLNSGYYTTLVLDGDLRWEWLPREVVQILEKKYEMVGPVIPNFREREMLPVTGALMKPRLVFRFRANTKG